MIDNVLKKLGFERIRSNDLIPTFHSNHYLRHNARRLEHLASLRLPLAGTSVLEVGAGIGDHSHYYLDRGCTLAITEARPENLRYLAERYPHSTVQFLDMENPTPIKGSPFDIVHCYGLLYHLKNPKQALEYLARNTNKMLLLETCVSFGENEEINLVTEKTDPSQAYSGTGCRPTRPWLFKILKEHFAYVYVPRTQPNHEEFPLDWTRPENHHGSFQRAIFIASRERLDAELLTTMLIDKQVRHE